MNYVMSDIHGNLNAFRSIMGQIDLKDEDTLYILGDVIDRHPFGIEILTEIMNMPNVKMLLGNHEYMMLSVLLYPLKPDGTEQPEDSYDLSSLWEANDGFVTKEAYGMLSLSEKQRLIEYLKALPLNFDVFVNDRHYKLVHAMPADQYPPIYLKGDVTQFCIWERSMQKLLPHLSRYITICGHTPTYCFAKINPLEIYYEGNMIAIDCGAGLSSVNPKGRLACLRLEDMKEFYSD